MSIPVKNGLFLGAAFFIGTILFVSVSPSGYLDHAYFPFLLIGILMMVKTATDVKSEDQGFASFGKLFKGIFITVAIGYLIRLIGDYISFKFISSKLSELFAERKELQLEKQSASMPDEQMDLFYNIMDWMSYDNLGFMLVLYCMYLVLTGCIVNAVISLIMKNERPLIDRV